MNTRHQVDRSHEMTLLTKLLEPSAKKTVLLLEAGSGYGKSMLLVRYMTAIDSGGHAFAVIDLARGANSAIDFLCGICHQWGWEHFPSFHTATERLAEPPAIDVSVRALQVGRPELQVMLPEDTAQRQARVQELTKAWFDDVRCWLEHSLPVVILVDTYNAESTEQRLATVDAEFCSWLDKQFLAQLVRTGALRLIMAGQQVPAQGLTSWERFCHRHRLGPIDNPDDWMEYVDVVGAHNVDRKTVSAFCRTEQGHPFSIAMRLSMLCDWSGE